MITIKKGITGTHYKSEAERKSEQLVLRLLPSEKKQIELTAVRYQKTKTQTILDGIDLLNQQLSKGE